MKKLLRERKWRTGESSAPGKLQRNESSEPITSNQLTLQTSLILLFQSYLIPNFCSLLPLSSNACLMCLMNFSRAPPPMAFHPWIFILPCALRERQSRRAKALGRKSYFTFVWGCNTEAQSTRLGGQSPPHWWSWEMFSLASPRSQGVQWNFISLWTASTTKAVCKAWNEIVDKACFRKSWKGIREAYFVHEELWI